MNEQIEERKVSVAEFDAETITARKDQERGIGYESKFQADVMGVDNAESEKSLVERAKAEKLAMK